MSWPLRAECPRCFGITGWYARYAPERNRCKCDVPLATESIPVEPLSDNTFGTVCEGDPLLGRAA